MNTLFETEGNSLIFATHPRNYIEYDYLAVAVTGSFDSFVKYRAWLFANAQSLGSILTLSTGTAAIGTIIFHLTRVWRHFIADQRYQNRTPAEALKFGFIPLRELFIILFFIVAPVSVTIVSVAIAMDIDGYSIPHFVLLAYLIPIGVLRVYIQGTDWHPHLREE